VADEKQAQERRRYYRLQPSPEAEPRVTFEFERQTLEVKLVNISPGGLLCYVDEAIKIITPELVIPRIVVALPNKKPVTYSGRVVRVQFTSEPGMQFCAVEFVRFEKKVLDKKSKPLPKPAVLADDLEFVQRLQSISNFSSIASIAEELTLRQTVYDGFAAEAKRLPLEERWYFFEVIDEMKRRQPNYPPGLQQEFCRLCHGEDRSEFVLTTKSRHRLKRFLKKILPI